MYFPIGWPKVLNIPQLGQRSIRQVVCNRDKILFAILTDDSLLIWFCKPCVPIVSHRRSQECVQDIGSNELVEWRPDSSMLVVATSGGHLLLYKVGVIAEQRSLYEQVDSPHPNLRRDSAELFIRETIPPLHLTLSDKVGIEGGITSMVCIRDELMLATTRGHVLRYKWDGIQNRDYCLDLRRVPFCIDQQVSKAIPIVEANTYIVDIEYSPLVGGFAIVLNDGRAAFLTATSLRFDPNQVQGIWAQNIDDATCASVNHKYRLIVFGRKNCECIVYCIDESSGGLEVSHHIVLSSKDYPGSPGSVQCMRWTPDGCALAVAWQRGGVSLWSTFGAMLMCTLGWDYGLHVDLSTSNPLLIHGMEWSAEGYQLWMVKRLANQKTDSDAESSSTDCIVQLDFVKSALTVNPCMSNQGHLYLQGEDRMFVNLGNNLTKVYSERPRDRYKQDDVFVDSGNLTVTSTLTGSRQWIVVPIPSVYSSTNWPIRYTAMDGEGGNLAVAGRTGLAHYSLATRKWKMFGNESQEKDFVVTGGLLWWGDHVVMGCYSIVDNRDELRTYPRDSRLDNAHVSVTRLSAQALLLNVLRDRLVVYCADGRIAIYSLADNSAISMSVTLLQSVDISALCVHPACVVSVTLTSLRTETGRHSNKEAESIMLNVSGRLLMVQREQKPAHIEPNNDTVYTCLPPTVLASCVENVWVPRRPRPHKPHLTEALWLYCGAHGMRVWLPLFPRDADKAHAFMSKRIMLPFQLRIYPLAILFEDAILLGAENDTMLYTSDSNSPFSLPFSLLEKTSQVYLHQILRQLIRRNLGYHAWEIARSCTALPYFPHALELLLHEVLEEEATSKEPIPDAQLPSVIEFIHEFPVYLQTVVQCARKTEIALWPYLFSAAGKPKDLFQECLLKKQLETAASYLIILQNLEPSSVSRQYATLLLDAALEHCKWELSKDLVRFLRAIDQNDVESPRTSFIAVCKHPMSPTTPVSPSEEDLSLVLGTMQVSRGRSFSTTATPKLEQAVPAAQSQPANHSKSVPVRRKKNSVPNASRDAGEGVSAEEFFMDVILQRHARRLLSARRLLDLGRFAARLDFHLVAWLCRERERAARVDDTVATLRRLHDEFSWPYPSLNAVHTGSAPASPSANEAFKSLAVDVSGVGDSGYMSGPIPGPHLPARYSPSITPSEYPGSSVVEARLMPHMQDSHDMMSEQSSVWGDERDLYEVAESRWSDTLSSQLLGQLSQAPSNPGTHKADVQLRYLLQLFLEANCLEWALVISVLLRDAMAVLRTTNAARSQEYSVESVQRLKDSLTALCQWSSTECLVYKPFMLAIQNQIVTLSKLMTGKQQLQQALLASQPAPSSPRLSRSRHSSHSCETAVGSELSESPEDAAAEDISPAVEVLEASTETMHDTRELETAKEQAIEGSGCQIS